MSNQLLPCPFCGHDEPTHDEGDESAWVQCTNAECGMCGPITSGPALAAAAWNRRATQAAAGEPVGRLEELEDGSRVLAFDLGFRNLPVGTRFYAGAPPAAAHGDEAVRKDDRVPGLEWAINKCTAMQEHGFDRVRLDLFKLDLQGALAAMRAQAGEGGEV